MAKKRPFTINLKFNSQWSRILREVEKTITPVNFINESIVYLNNGDEVVYDVKQMFDEGYKSDEIADSLNDEYEM